MSRWSRCTPETGSGFVRACFATSYEQLMTASDRIERYVQSLASKPKAPAAKR